MAGFKLSHLEAELLASVSSNTSLDISRPKQRVAVRDAGKFSGRSRVGAATEGNILNHCVSNGVAVGALDGLGGAGLEDGRLDEELGSHAGVDATVSELVVVVVEDMAGAEAEGGGTAVDVAPVVVCVGDVQVAGVLG
jgi:hypothetical protein